MLSRFNWSITPVFAIVATCSGCHEVVWTDWGFVEIERQSHQQNVQITSTPPGATVHLDNERIGITPTEVKIPYTATAAVFERRQIEREGFEERVLETERQRRKITINRTARILKATRPHYLDEIQPLVAPGARTVRLTLQQITYDWEPIDIQEDQPRKQAITITSEPGGATVFINGQTAGTTPLSRDFDYAETEIIFQRTVVYERRGPSPRTEVETKKETGGTSARAYDIELKRAGYLYERFHLTVPRTKDYVHKELVEATGITDIDSTLKITARREYFPPIENLIAARAVPNLSGNPIMEESPAGAPVPVSSGLDVYEQTFSLLVKDTAEFAVLVAQLQALAEEEEFVFHITNARLAADFDTNVMEGMIEHVINGRVRPGSALYLVSFKGVPSPGDRISVEDDGQYALKIKLRKGQTHVYLLSIYVPPNNRYAPPLAVFTSVDVYSQKAAELSQDQFQVATGLMFPDDLIRQLAPTAIRAPALRP